MAVNQLAIDRLRLDEAFSTGTHRPFNDCWTVRMDRCLLIVDDDQEHYSRFSEDQENQWKAIMIVNEENREVVLLSIDNKLIANHRGGIADCAVFDDEQFHLIEFKTNAYGHSEESARDTFDKAISQLEETICVFSDKLQSVSIEFMNAVVLSCHIVVSNSFPKSKATKQEYRLKFADNHNGIELSFAEKIYWEKIGGELF